MTLSMSRALSKPGRFGLMKNLVPLLIAGAGLLEATPITYTFSGSGSGTLGSTAFTNQNFVATLNTDTSDIFFQGALSSVGDIGLPASINIAGIGNETFLGTTVTAALSSEFDFAVGDAGLFTAPGNIFSLVSPALIGYDQVSNITVTAPNNYLSSFVGVDTSGGALTFTRMSTVTFQAVAGTPEPGSVWLLSIGLGLIGFRGALRIKRTRAGSSRAAAPCQGKLRG
jgi:hypothetical protein